jgi:transmembrane sensor
VWVDLDRVAALQAGAAQVQERPGERRRRATGVRRWIERHATASPIAAAAAAVIAVVGAVSIGAYQYFDGRLVSTHGEVRRVALDDGSTVVLDSDSIVQVRFSAGERTVFLRRGEASFQVAHDKARPFIVHADNVAVRAVGTNFAVQLQPDKVSVTVAEGTVAVTRPTGAGGKVERRFVTRDGALTAAARQPMRSATLSDADLTRRLAWRDGLLMFDGERMDAATVEVNRYAARPVIIDDPKVAKEAFVGVFRAGDSKAFADSAAAAYDDKVVEQSDGLHVTAR